MIKNYAIGITFLLLSFFSFSQQFEKINFDWSRRLGSIGTDSIVATTTDKEGGVYVAGNFTGTVNFNTDSARTQLLTSYGKEDVYIMKLSPFGKFLWVKQIGGANSDKVNSLAFFNDSIYALGTFEGTATIGNFSKSSTGIDDAFLVSLNVDGAFFLCKTFGGNANLKVTTLNASNSGLIISGEFSGSYNNLDGDVSLFVQQLGFDGKLNWIKKLGTKHSVFSKDIATDNSFIYLTGVFKGDKIDFNPGVKDSLISSTKFSFTPFDFSEDIFVLKLTILGDFVWVRNIVGNSYEKGNAIALLKNTFVIGGSFKGSIEFSKNVAFSGKGGDDIFIASYSSDGTHKWSKQIGGTKDDEVKCVELDTIGNMFATGFFNDAGITSGLNFNDASTPLYLKSEKTKDAFILKLSSIGKLLSASDYGGSGDDLGTSLIVDNNQNVVFNGVFDNTIKLDEKSYTSIGGKDVFLFKNLQRSYKTTYIKCECLPGEDLYDIEVLSQDIGDFTWRNINDILIGANLPKGDTNSILIDLKQGDGDYASRMCTNLIINKSSDWFLPSEKELNWMYKYKDSIGNFKNKKYWSSSEKDITNAYSVDFSNKVTLTGTNEVKSQKYAVRPIRKKNKNLGLYSLTSSRLSIYPNPTSNVISISYEQLTVAKEIVISDLNGRLLFSKLLPIGSTSELIDLNQFPIGIYLLNWVSEFGTSSVKVVKE